MTKNMMNQLVVTNDMAWLEYYNITIGFRKNCEDTSQIKAIVESDSKDSNGVMN